MNRALSVALALAMLMTALIVIVPGGAEAAVPIYHDDFSVGSDIQPPGWTIYDGSASGWPATIDGGELSFSGNGDGSSMTYPVDLPGEYNFTIKLYTISYFSAGQNTTIAIGLKGNSTATPPYTAIPSYVTSRFYLASDSSQWRFGTNQAGTYNTTSSVSINDWSSYTLEFVRYRSGGEWYERNTLRSYPQDQIILQDQVSLGASTPEKMTHIILNTGTDGNPAVYNAVFNIDWMTIYNVADPDAALPPALGAGITSEPVTTLYEGFGYIYQATASEPVTSWSISGGSGWLYINETGLVYSTGGGELGNYPISIAAVTDSGTYWQNYTLSVISMFSSSPITVGQEGIAYSYQATIKESPYSWSMTGPAWLSITNGTVTGTPPIGAAGQHNITISVWTYNGEDLARSNQDYVLEIAGNSGMAFSSIPPTTLYEGRGYMYQVETSLDVASWSISGGSGWLYINETGLVYSTGGGELGNYPISIAAVTDSGTYWQNYTLSVISMFSSSPVTTARDDVAYSYQAVSREQAVNWSVAGPAWLTISQSGLITGTPPIGAAGQHQVEVSVWTYNGEDLARSNQLYNLEVLPNAAFAFTSQPLANATSTVLYEYQAVSRYAVTAWTITGPEWLTISQSGLVTGTAPNGTEGSYEIVIRATLSDGTHAYQGYDLKVQRLPMSNQDAMAMAFGALAFMIVLSSLLGIVATARRR